MYHPSRVGDDRLAARSPAAGRNPLLATQTYIILNRTHDIMRPPLTGGNRNVSLAERGVGPF